MCWCRNKEHSSQRQFIMRRKKTLNHSIGPLAFSHLSLCYPFTAPHSCNQQGPGFPYLWGKRNSLREWNSAVLWIEPRLAPGKSVSIRKISWEGGRDSGYQSFRINLQNKKKNDICKILFEELNYYYIFIIFRWEFIYFNMPSHKFWEQPVFSYIQPK